MAGKISSEETGKIDAAVTELKNALASNDMAQVKAKSDSFRKCCRKSEQRFTSKQRKNTQNSKNHNSNPVKRRREKQDHKFRQAVLKVKNPKAAAKRKWLTQKTTR